MARDNGGDDVFVTDDDRKSFLFRLGQVCASHGWKVAPAKMVMRTRLAHIFGKNELE
jgi:hypothetical protein